MTLSLTCIQSRTDRCLKSHRYIMQAGLHLVHAETAVTKHLGLGCAVQIVFVRTKTNSFRNLRYMNRSRCLSDVDIRWHWRFTLQFAHIPQQLHSAYASCAYSAPNSIMESSYIKLIDDAKGDRLDGAPRSTSPVSVTKPVWKRALGHRANLVCKNTRFLPACRSATRNVGYVPIAAASTCMSACMSACMCQCR